MNEPRPLVIALAAWLVAGTAGAEELPATRIAYEIEASLDPATRRLEGEETIRWTNPTDEALAALPLHLYLNGFAHSRSTWMSERPPRVVEDLLRREPDPWGSSELRAITQRLEGGERALSFRPIRPDDGNPLDHSLYEIALAAPVPPGGEVVLRIAFSARLPVPIARTGGRGDYFLIAQWYPKIGVIEPAGVRHAPRARSAARQFHAPTEFYADFADYDVRFRVPAGFTVGATGRAVVPPAPVRGDAGRVEVHYRQRAVHDFALVAGSHLEEAWVKHRPAGGGPEIDIRFLTPVGTASQIPRWQSAVVGALDILGRRVGPYPYTTLTVVLPPFWASATAGMEYPTFITGGPGDPLWDHPLLARLRMPEEVVIHEFGHQYFYGLLASNEQEEAFLDEGFNTYWEFQIVEALYGPAASAGYLLGRPLVERDMRTINLSRIAGDVHEALRKRPSWLFFPGTWNEQVYGRAGVTLATCANLFGTERLDRVFRAYFQRFAFRHPDVEDFLGVAAEVGGAELAGFLREAFSRTELPDYRVEEVKSERYQPPLGRVPTPQGVVEVTPKRRQQHAELGLPAEAREADGRVLVEVSDAGWVDAAESRTGTIEQRLVAPARREAAARVRSEGFHESTVRLVGPGWQRLPVRVEFRFADGVVVEDRWDGKAAWRRYRFLRPAPLEVVRIDPRAELAVDVWPENNALAVKPDRGFRADWGSWLGAVTEWLAGGLALWL